MLVRKSGRVQLVLGDITLDVSLGTSCSFLQVSLSLTRQICACLLNMHLICLCVCVCVGIGVGEHRGQERGHDRTRPR